MDKEDMIRMMSNNHIEVKGDFVIEKKVQYEVNQVDPNGIGILIADPATAQRILAEKTVSAQVAGQQTADPVSGNAPSADLQRKDEMRTPNRHEPVADDKQTADPQRNGMEQHSNGATTQKRALFIRKDGSSAENEAVRRQEKERFMQYLQDHHMENHVLTCSVDNPLNEVVTGFALTWIDRQRTLPNPAGTAIFRFLTTDCGLRSEVTDRSYGNKIMERIKIEHCSKEIQQEINRYFD